MNLQHRQSKIQEKRKHTPWREFVMEICSWRSLNFYKNNSHVSIFPPNKRSGRICGIKEYSDTYSDKLNNTEFSGQDFLQDLQELFIDHTKPTVYHVGVNEGCEYSNTCFGSKNAYLTFVSGYGAENIAYSTQTWQNVTHIYSSSLITNGSTNMFINPK